MTMRGCSSLFASLIFPGAVNLRMRESVALELSGYSLANEFDTACGEACLRFPLLSSVRVLVRSKAHGASEPSMSTSSDAPEVSAIVVEATAQLWDAECAPNLSMFNLSALLSQLPMPSNRMVVARVRDFIVAPHAGMCVKMNETLFVPVEYALVLIAATTKSSGQSFGDGYRVVTKNVMDIDFTEAETNLPVTSDCVSICTTDNLVNYKMAPSKPGTNQFALALVSGYTPATEMTKGSLMIDYVESIASEHLVEYKNILRKLALLAKGATFATDAAKRPAWSPSRTPYSGQKSRRLAYHPTDVSMPES